MIVDLLRWARDVAADPVSGVNAQLPGVPVDPGESPPDVVALYNELDHTWVGRGSVPRDLFQDENGNARRLLILQLHPDPEGFLARILPQEEAAAPTIVPLVWIFACRKIERAGEVQFVQAQIRDARQTMRTVMRVLAGQFDTPFASHERNQCSIMLPGQPGFTLNSQFVEASADHVADTLITPFRVVDRWAMGL